MTIGMGDKEKSMGNRTLKHMVLENLALWKERYLLDEQGDQEKGYMGYVKGVFENEVRRMDNVAWMRKVDDTTAFHDEFESLFHFLESKAAGYMLRSLADTSAFCKNKLHNHIPYYPMEYQTSFYDLLLSQKNADGSTRQRKGTARNVFLRFEIYR